MVEFRTPQLVPSARPADPVSSATSEGLTALGRSAQGAANTFTQFYEEEARVQRELIVANMQSEFSQRFAATSRDAGTGYAKSFMDEFSQYRDEVLRNAPQRGRSDLELVVERFRIDLEGRAEQAEIAARARRAAAAASEAQRLRLNALVSNPDLLEEYVAQYPSHASDFVRTANAARAMDDPIGVAAAVQSGAYDAYYTPTQKISIIEAGRAAEARSAREQEAARRVARDDFLGQIDEETAYIEANGHAPLDGYSANPEAMAEIMPDLFPEDARANAMALIDERVRQAQANYDAGTATPDEISAEIERRSAAISAPGSTDSDVADMNRYISALQARETAINEDAARYVISRNDEVQAQFEAISSSETPEETAIAVGQYVSAANAEYDRLGVPVSLRRLMPVDQARQIVTSLNDAGPDVLAQNLIAISDQWSDPRLLGELSAAGLNTHAASAMRHADNPGLASTIIGLSGQTATDLADGLPTVDVTAGKVELVDALADYRSAFEAGDPTGSASASFSREYGVAEKLMLRYMRGGMTASSAATRAASEMFPETPINQSNMKILIPQGVDEWNVEVSLTRAASEDAIRAFDPAPLNDPMFMEFQNKEVMIAAAQNGVWLNNSTGDGAVLNLDLGGFFLPVTNANGDYYEVKFSDTGPQAGGLIMPPKPPSGWWPW